MEAWARIELAYSSFAENRLTTWPPGPFSPAKLEERRGRGLTYSTILSIIRRYDGALFLQYRWRHQGRG